MTIFFTQGTLNPASTSLARDIRNAWVSAFTGQPNWTVLDNGYVNGTIERTVITNSNGFSIMLANSTTLTNTSLYVIMGRTYNATTHIMSDLAFGGNIQRDPNPDSNCWSALTLNPSSILSYTSTYNPAYISGYDDTFITATASQTAWSAHINNDYATLSVKTGGANNGQWVHFGKATSLVYNTLLTDTYPYFLSTSTTTVPGYYREAQVLNALGNPNGTVATSNGARLYPGKITLPPAAITYYDRYSATSTVGTLAPIYIARNNPITGTDNYLAGALRAKLQDIMTADSSNAIWGDYAVVGAKTYMYIGGNIATPGANSTILAGWAAIN